MASKPHSNCVVGNIIVALLGLGISGCSTYDAYLILRPQDSHISVSDSKKGLLTDSDAAKVREIMRRIARENGMEPSPGWNILKKLFAEDKPPCDLLAFYEAHFNPPGYYGNSVPVTMDACLMMDRSELFVGIRDMQHGGETKFVKGLREEIGKTLEATFPDCRIQFEKRRGLQNFYAP